MKHLVRALVPLFSAAALLWAADARIDPNLYLEDVKYLASPALKGRASGSPELETAAAFLAAKYKSFGVKPVDGKGYLQPFQVTTDAKLGPQNHFSFTEGGRTTTLADEREYVPFSFSSSAKFAGNVIFAGYGITAPEFHYDDYDGVDVKGKVVVVLRHTPQESQNKTVFTAAAFTQHAAFVNKAANAKMHGAIGLILIEDRLHHPNEPWEVAKFRRVEGPKDAGLAIVEVKESAVDGWFKEAGKSLEKIESDIDKDLKPESFSFPSGIKVNAQVDIEHIVKTVHNVVAYIPGQTDEYVILGAHYDHLGLGGEHSLAPSVTAVHPGADDNASGTAGVVELARWFAQQPKQRRGVLFLNFAGEELGLLGSAWYVAHPLLPLDRAAVMINMDMIGRIRDGKVYVGSTSTGSGMRQLMEQVAAKYPLKVDFSEGPESGSSDHTSFISGKVPSLFVFSGLHSDYHKPSDTWDKIDAPAAARLLGMVAEIAGDLRDQAGRPQFTQPAPPAHGPGAVGPVTGSAAGGYGPWFGSIPDFGEGVKGVKFADISAGSPAAKAGFKAGDVMVEFDGKKIENLYDFTYALRSKQPGDKVQVKVIRDGKPLEETVLLTRRP